VCTTTVRTGFVARHYLTIPDPGPEGKLHSHHFRAELELRDPELGEYDYLVDIDEDTAALEALADRYTDATLDDLPEFDGYNPGVERFSRVVFDRVTDDTVAELAVAVREDDGAAGYTAAV
jgi:6-pyruvoyltetrahydropterin/6-carboxytetrahydropterin synthase